MVDPYPGGGWDHECACVACCCPYAVPEMGEICAPCEMGSHTCPENADDDKWANGPYGDEW